MKTLFQLVATLLFVTTVYSQDNIDELLAAGIADAQRFTTDYIAPANEGLAYGLNNGWSNNAKAPRRFKFELSIIGNASFIKDEKKTFLMNISDYENIRFPDNSPSKSVATSLGNNDPDVSVIVTYDDPIFGNQEVEVTLPTGIGSADVNLIPTAFLQGSFSPFKGTQVKARYFPTVNTEEVNLGLYGVGIQQEFTSWLPAEKLWPVAISGLVAYTHLDASYDFTETGIVDGENQQIQTEVNTILAQLIVGTRLKIINLYGTLGYINGSSKTDLLGTYRVSNGSFTSEEITDPFSIDQDISGVRASVGATLKLGFFGLTAEYSMGEFDSASLGINISI
ncbi:MAG: hypothetical protein HKN99_06760 [Winogradskyella sp.]|nr:hypothetical protein [Winogradskyella sp.]MBT8376648.1 hypothetical protein [Bacteroidia bacterium]NNC45566.1 hypothetical protein [Winogradskyella sp.]NNF85831.1 hypothetical protein [Winogradskyella sp.]NNL83344.1 hypothetical protein [Winogradskyella sp.]